jgi:hypothetical protein
VQQEIKEYFHFFFLSFTLKGTTLNFLMANNNFEGEERKETKTLPVTIRHKKTIMCRD